MAGQQVGKNENNEAVTDDVAEQTELVFRSIDKILRAAGASIDHVVKAQIFVTDIDDFTAISAVRDKWFATCQPTSTIVEVTGMTRRGAKVEIEVVAVLPK